jgi:hypothetical protein
MPKTSGRRIPTTSHPQIIYLLRELWRGFSARAERVVPPGGNRGLTRSTADLTLVRWDVSRPATVDNLVLLTMTEADAHQATTLEALRREEPEFVAYVESQLARVRFEYCGDYNSAPGAAARRQELESERQQQQQQQRPRSG